MGIAPWANENPEEKEEETNEPPHLKARKVQEKRYEHIEKDLKASPGAGTIQRRKVTKKRHLVQFHAVNECIGGACPIQLYCKFKKTHSQCQIQTKYLHAVAEKILEDVDYDDLTGIQLLKIGMHIMPLYRSLCRLKMEELSLRRVTQLTSTGGRTVHSVYREIRETVKTLEVVLKGAGLDDNGKKSRENDSFYEELFGGEENKPGLVRRK